MMLVNAEAGPASSLVKSETHVHLTAFDSSSVSGVAHLVLWRAMKKKRGLRDHNKEAPSSEWKTGPIPSWSVAGWQLQLPCSV